MNRQPSVATQRTIIHSYSEWYVDTHRLLRLWLKHFNGPCTHCNGACSSCIANVFKPISFSAIRLSLCEIMVLCEQFSLHSTLTFRKSYPQNFWAPGPTYAALSWRVQYKLVMLMYGIVVGTCPEYLRTIVEPATPSHPGLRSAACSCSSYRVYAPSSVNVPSASPARWHGTHCLPTSGARRTDKLSKHYWNLISSVRLLIFHSYCWLFTVRRSCPFSNGRPTNLHWWWWRRWMLAREWFAVNEHSSIFYSESL